MAEPLNPFSTSAENPEPSSPVAAEEEVEVNAPGKNLPVLRWSRSSFEMLMRDIQMPPEYGATYPQEGGTAGDAPAGYVTIPLGMIRVRNFEYTFRALGIEPIVGDFQRFYQLSVSMGFFSFRQREHTPKLMIPPKGMTKWKTKFFYIKVAAITAKLQFRNVTGTIITENISVPKADAVDWFPDLRITGWVKLDNRQLWVLRMMLGRMSRNARPVVWEKSGEKAPMWRMFCPVFKGEVAIVACADGDLGALGDPAVTGVPKQPALKFSDKHQRKPKKPHEVVVVPPLVPEVAGISRTHLCKYDDYVVVSDTLEGLGVPGGVAAAGGSSAGTKPVDDKKRKGDAPVAGGQKAPKLRRTRATAIPKPTPAVTTGKLIICYTSVVVPVVTDGFFCRNTGRTCLFVCHPSFFSESCGRGSLVGG
ncbi:hypothetical protein HanPI659440_Chr15g0605681 [Helianthus annuus]|nr:hypothetical protein HanPI659440_Chr15g0605681 [Helianthus annuus]